MSDLQATTWIDHGTANYQFAFKNRLSDEIRLSDFLRPFGVQNYWSYVDVADNPLLLTKPRPGFRRAWRSRRGLLRFCRRLQPRSLAYLALHQLRDLRAHTISHAWRYWREMRNRRPSRWAEWRAASSLKRHAITVYSPHGVAPGLALEDDWIFDTVLLNHLAIQLRPESLDSLVDDSSVFIGHCYLTAQHDHALGNCFVGDRNAPQLDREWVRAVEELAVRQEQGVLAVLPFADLRRCLSSFYSSRLLRRREGWQLRCRAVDMDAVVAGPAAAIQRYSCSDSPRVFRGSVGLFTRLKDTHMLIRGGEGASEK